MQSFSQPRDTVCHESEETELEMAELVLLSACEMNSSEPLQKVYGADSHHVILGLGCREPAVIYVLKPAPLVPCLP